MENIGYMLAVFIIVWAAFFGYLIAITQRQRRLQQELEDLKGELDIAEDKALS